MKMQKKKKNMGNSLGVGPWAFNAEGLGSWLGNENPTSCRVQQKAKKGKEKKKYQKSGAGGGNLSQSLIFSLVTSN